MRQLLTVTCILCCSILFANIALAELDPARILDLDWSSNGTYIAFGRANGTVELWDASTNTHVTNFMGHTQETHVLKFSPNGQQLASGSPDGTIRIWSIETREIINIIKFSTPIGGMRALLDLDWNFDGTLIAAARDNNYIFIWDTQTGEQIAAYRHEDMPLSVDWHPSENILVSSGIGEDIWIWDSDNKVPRIFEQNLSNAVSIHSVKWSPTGEQIAIARYRHGVQIFNYPSMTLTLETEPTQNALLSLYWSPNGTQLAIGMVDNIMVINATTGTVQNTILGYYASNNRVAWSPYGGRLALITDTPPTFADGNIQIIVPDPSFEHFQAVAQLCGAPTDLVPDPLEDFTAHLDTLDIPPACRADLLAIAAALQD